MIRHRPLGRGHPYVVDPDQRFPVRPSAGAAFDLGITTDADARGIHIEIDGAGTFPLERLGEARPIEDPTWGAAGAAGAGDLTAVTALAPEPGRSAWRYGHPGLAAGERLRYRFVGPCEATRWFEVRPCVWEGDRFGDGELVYAVRFTLPLEPGWHVLGFGERFDALDQRGRRLQTAVYDQYKGQGARSYLPVPFAIVAGGGYGVYVETGHRVRVDAAEALVLEVDLEPGEAAPEVPLHVFRGSPAEVLRAYLDLTGTPKLPPDWAFRLWMSGNQWNSEERVRREVERSFDEAIPPGVVVIEAWSDETTFTRFGDAWPDPKSLVDDLHARDVRVLLWQIPLVRREAADDVATMTERGYCVHDGDGEPYGNPGGWFDDALLLDVTNEEAVRWWIERRRWLVDELGIDGFKTDGGEHAWSPELRYADGTRGGETNNRYPVLYADAYHRLVPLTFSRAGYAGSQRVPAYWAGDQDSTWESLRACITAGLTAGASGIFFWGFDLGGFSGPLPSAELYLRSAAAAALCPIMQYHSELGSPDRTPWSFEDERVLPAFRAFVQAREALVPYLAGQARASLPLMRALPLVTDDDRAWEFPYQWLLGDGLLVAPVVEPGTESRCVYVPTGTWLDPLSGEALREGVHELPCPLDRLPVLVAASFADRLAPVFEPVPVEV